MIRCFLLEPTDEQRVYLRRYRASTCPPPCPLGPEGGWTYHDARALLATEPIVYGDRDWASGKRRVIESRADFLRPSNDDPQWPTHCGCGLPFAPDDEWQVFQEQLWRRTDTGEVLELRDAPPGALWYAWWMDDLPQWHGPDGRSLICRTPGGDWEIDGRASNCTMPDDWEHRCWIRHGTPPDITVDKSGQTCAAGAGSILAGSYHGFLQNGHLT